MRTSRQPIFNGLFIKRCKNAAKNEEEIIKTRGPRKHNGRANNPSTACHNKITRLVEDRKNESHRNGEE
jgi:hypothetical protein